MYVERQGLEAIRDNAARARERIEQAYQEHLKALAEWDDEKAKAKYTPTHIVAEKARVRAEYQSKVHAVIAETEAARANLEKAAEERSPASLLKRALDPGSPPDVAAATLVELRTARLREDAKAASGDELAMMIEAATQERDLHRVALVQRELERRDRAKEWELSDRTRVRAKVAIDAALDQIEAFAPGRSEEVQVIEQAAAGFHACDEFAHAALTNAEPLPVAMARAEQKRKAASDATPPAGPGDVTMLPAAG